jgi:hypothetical protein
MQKVKLYSTFILGNSLACTYLMLRMDLLASQKGADVRYKFGKLYHVMFCIKLISVFRFCCWMSSERYFAHVCRQTQKWFITSTLEVCGNYSLRAARKLIEGMSVYLSFKPLLLRLRNSYFRYQHAFRVNAVVILREPWHGFLQFGNAVHNGIRRTRITNTRKSERRQPASHLSFSVICLEYLMYL